MELHCVDEKEKSISDGSDHVCLLRLGTSFILVFIANRMKNNPRFLFIQAQEN